MIIKQIDNKETILADDGMKWFEFDNFSQAIEFVKNLTSEQTEHIERYRSIKNHRINSHLIKLYKCIRFGANNRAVKAKNSSFG